MVSAPSENPLGRPGRSGAIVLIIILAAGGAGYAWWRQRGYRQPEAERPTYAKARYTDFNRFGFWLGEVPRSARARATDTGSYSNIAPEDYTVQGAKKCAECHEREFNLWSHHSHRWMNAAATPSHVKGDFSGRTSIHYLGGAGTFWREGDAFHLAAARGKTRREFRITRTIGSRYFEYYVGVQTAGPEPADDPRYQTEHVMPFGYWLTKRQWVPTVHIREDRADDTDDPKLNPYEDFYFRAYDEICARCHTTLPIGDSLIRAPDYAGKYTPYRFSMDLTGYLERQRPGLMPASVEHTTTEELQDAVGRLIANQPPARILHLGIICEACHNGCKQHAADSGKTAPHFFPTSPLILADLPKENAFGRTHDNINWICSRCHTGLRPQFPGGMSTWNSAECSDAMRGSCYSKLRCTDCHDPHRTIGPVWSHSEDHDDRLCLKCHTSLREAATRQAHTHHASGSDGDRCMNCHMPRVNEGLDTVVRTHQIHSPTRADVIENNGPNACNLCHLERPIDWTLGYLQKWYSKKYSQSEIERNYPLRQEPVGVGWLTHQFRATRMVAAAAYARQKRRDALPVLLSILDDKYLLNRQFGQLAVEELCGVSLGKWGYSFMMAPEERADVLAKIREELVKQ
jgi:predicted CXXCH cytochrome family protein